MQGQQKAEPLRTALDIPGPAHRARAGQMEAQGPGGAVCSKPRSGMTRRMHLGSRRANTGIAQL